MNTKSAGAPGLKLGDPPHPHPEDLVGSWETVEAKFGSKL